MLHTLHQDQQAGVVYLEKWSVSPSAGQTQS